MSCILDERVFEDNLSHNITLLRSRFSSLYNILKFNQYSPLSLLKMIPKEYELLHSLKDDGLTLKVNDKYIHSKYNPILEGEKVYSYIKENYCFNLSFCFFGLGLAYSLENFVKENKEAKLILVEPDIFIFILFLSSRKLDFLFSHASLIIIPATPPTETIAILENIEASECNTFYFQVDLQVSKNWFLEFNTLKTRHHKKNLLNCNTMKKFYLRWLKNFIKNFDVTSSLPSISKFKNAFSNIPAVVFAAGPSLDEHIQMLKNLQEQFIIIAVDTSLKALLEQGINPDFVLLMDGQYLNYLHIAGVDSPSSILITEASVYPSVFYSRFKAKCLIASFFPLGKYIEEKIRNNESLSAGGSVATTSWDFARFIGVNPIIMAGLDLAFTHKKTHSLACKFEKEAIIFSDRFSTLEKASYKMLDAKNTEIAEGYKGKVITDSKMKMFAWWFESKIEEYPNIHTYNFMAQGLKIPNMPSIEKKDLLAMLSKKELKNKKDLIELLIQKEKKDEMSFSFDKILSSFNYLLELVNEALQSLETKQKNIMHQFQDLNEKVKKDEVYLHSGFDVILKSIEAELFNTNLKEGKNKKIFEFYTLLKNILIESIALLNKRAI
ncbi:MAG: motility associated factor glycosyltransferase family protein [Treponema sp.]